MKGSLTADEREVVLLFNDADQTWHLFCDSRSLGSTLRKWLARIGLEPTILGAGFEVGGIPRRAVSFRGKAVKRVMSDTQRKAASERMRALGKARKGRSKSLTAAHSR